jgi:GPH family glycoside/pentoside/hexuronide:cation symporter
MNSTTHPTSTIRPEDRVSFWLKTAYGAASTVNYFGGQLLKVLSASIFVTGMGMSPAGIGIVFLIFRLWDACLDPFMGWLSDNTRTRWGRRRPYVLIGGLLTGLIFPLLWIGRAHWSETWKFGWLIGIGLVFYTAFTVWVMPFSSMLPEMTPDTDERTSITSFQSFSARSPAFSACGSGRSRSFRSLTIRLPANPIPSAACASSVWHSAC